jgi:rhamnosyl/mannosyltransferase
LDGVTEARELDFQSGMQFVLFVGRLVYYKGLEYLIRAMQHVDATLVIVGDGPLRKELERLSRELRVDHKVRFAGRVPTETLHKYYRACLCLVLPSVERSEAFGVVQLEAMAYGKPVVNTSLPTGVPFVSVHGETGLTVPPRDPSALAEALNRLCREEELRRRLGRQARKRVETMFSKDVILTQIKSIYRELLRQRPRGREMCRCAACQSG